MIAVDTNLLVYSHRTEIPGHSVAYTAIDELREGAVPWAIPWPCVHEFIAIVTHPKIFKKATTLAQAFACIDAWRAAGNLQFLGENGSYLDQLRDLATKGKVRGPQIHDARIAALCLRHGVKELWTADRDFSAFPRLKTRNPLAPS